MNASPYLRRLLLALLAVAPLAAPARAQQKPQPAAPGAPAFRADAPGFRQPDAKTEVNARVTSANAAPALNPTVYSNVGYIPASPYGPTFSYTDPYSGFLNGAASLVSAEGQFRIANQQSKVIAEQAKQAGIDTRRKSVEEWMYERSTLPTNEDLREEAQWAALRRARNNPAVTEILSGAALNDLMQSIVKTSRGGAAGPAVPLSEDLLRHINFTGGDTYRGSGLLKDGGELRWPIPLTDTAFEKQRQKADDLVRQSLRQVSTTGRADSGMLRDLGRALDDLEDAVRARARDLTPTESIQAKRYLRELKESCAVLRQPDVGKSFASRPRAATAGELIGQMNAMGLRFAPAESIRSNHGSGFSSSVTVCGVLR